MTKREIANIAKRMDEATRLLIDKEVEERLEILKEGDLSESELNEMEECLYASLVIQEFLNGEYDLLEEERQELFDHMEEMYNKYSDLLVRARIEEKVGKKKRMALELMKIREKLMQSKEDYKNIKNRMKDNREDYKKLNDMTKKSKMKELAKQNKADQNRGKGFDINLRGAGTPQTAGGGSNAEKGLNTYLKNAYAYWAGVQAGQSLSRGKQDEKTDADKVVGLYNQEGSSSLLNPEIETNEGRTQDAEGGSPFSVDSPGFNIPEPKKPSTTTRTNS